MSNTPTNYSDRLRSGKPWDKILFRPGYSVQSSELNEIQSIQDKNRQRLGNVFLSEGAILSGCEVVVNSTNGSTVVSPGEVYFDGLIHITPELTTTVPTTGDIVLNLVVTPDVIDEVEDPDLLGKEQGTESYNKPGAHRLTYTYSLSVNVNNAIKLARITEGNLTQTYGKVNPSLDPVLKILAKRTFDESGNFTVDPFKLKIDYLPEEDSQYRTHMKLSIKGGSFYVQGYKSENTITILRLPRPLDTKEILDEPENYADGTTVYSLDNTPVLRVGNITATVQEDDISIVRGAVGGGQDTVPVAYQPIVDIPTITSAAGGGGTVYVKDVDYQIVGNTIDWSLSGAEPSTGSTYYATIQFIKQLTRGIRQLDSNPISSSITISSNTVDTTGFIYLLPLSDSLIDTTDGNKELKRDIDYTVDYTTGSITWINKPALSNSIAFSGKRFLNTVEGDYMARNSFLDENGNEMVDYIPNTTLSGDPIDYGSQFSFDTSGDKPVNGTQLLIDYEYTLGRVDYITVDYLGNMRVLLGNSKDTTTIPTTDPGTMIIGILTHPAEGHAENVLFDQSDTTRLTQASLNDLLDEVRRIKYNQSLYELETSAAEQITASEKLGIFADDFRDFNKADLGSTEYAATIDPIVGEVCLPQQMYTLPVDPKSVHSSNKKGDYYSLNYTEELIATQPYATDFIQINPYTSLNTSAELILDPKVDRFTHTEVTNVQMPDRTVTLPTQFIRNHTFSSSSATQVRNVNTVGNISVALPERVVSSVSGSGRRLRSTVSLSREVVNLGTVLQSTNVVNRFSTSSTSTSISNSVSSRTTTETRDEHRFVLAPYAREISVTINGEHFFPEEDNIRAFFDGDPVPLTATNGTVAGTTTGTVKAKLDGTWEATFTVPKNTSAGDHNVLTEGDGINGGLGTYVDTTYSSEGKIDKITRFVTHVTTQQPTQTTRIHTHTTNTTVIDQNVVTRTGGRQVRTVSVVRFDPLAQTFEFSESTFLSSVEVFFRTKDSTTIPVDVLIVPTIAGIPTVEIIGRKLLQPSEVVTSEDATAGTKFTFDTPVFCEANKEYAFIVRTESALYTAHISKVGDIDPVLGKVVKQPFSGVMLTSANMSTWTPHQISDVTFNMYGSVFDSESTIEIDPITFPSPVNRFEFNTFSIEPDPSCSITWEWSKDLQVWKEFIPLSEVISKDSFTTLYVRATLKGPGTLTPVFTNTCYAKGFYWELTGNYISREFSSADKDVRYVDVYLDTELPSGTTLAVYAQLDSEIDGNGDPVYVQLTEIPGDAKQLDENFWERHYQLNLDPSDTGNVNLLKERAKIKLEMGSPEKETTPFCRRLRAILSAV